MGTDAEGQVESLYRGLLDGWNRRAPDDFAGLFADDGVIVGFDGSQVAGRQQIASHLHQVFADHQTATYVGKVSSRSNGVIPAPTGI